MKVYSYGGKQPKIGRGCMIADSVILIGDVEIGDNCSLWPGVVIRSDTTPIRIGNNVQIEEHTIIHTSTVIEDNVMIGHRCCIEGFIGTGSLLGNTAAIMPYGRLGRFSALAAGSIITDFKEIPDYSFAVGSPAKVHSQIDPENPKHVLRQGKTYIDGDKGIAALAKTYIEAGIWEHRDV